jgi:hypothetical protein
MPTSLFEFRVTRRELFRRGQFIDPRFLPIDSEGPVIGDFSESRFGIFRFSVPKNSTRQTLLRYGQTSIAVWPRVHLDINFIFFEKIVQLFGKIFPQRLAPARTKEGVP